MPRVGARAFTLERDTATTPHRSTMLMGRTDLLWIEAEYIEIDETQPRQTERPTLDNVDDSTRELADDIAELGIHTPLAVRPPDPTTGKHRIIAGERRFIAGQLAGIDRYPCMVQDVDKRDAFRRAVSENIQRKNLLDIDAANALRRLKELYELPTEEELARFVNKSLSWVQRLLAASQLDIETQRIIAERHEPIAIAPHLRPQPVAARQATLQAIAPLPSRDEKVSAVVAINEHLGRGETVEQAIERVGLAPADRVATRPSHPAPITLPFEWKASTSADSKLLVNPRTLAITRVCSKRQVAGWEWSSACLEDITAFRDACASRTAQTDDWEELRDKMAEILDLVPRE